MSRFCLRPPIQFPARDALPSAAPLLEEGDLGPTALLQARLHPLGLHGPSARPGLAADNHPRHPVKVQIGHRAQERFARQEPHRSRNRAEIVDAAEDSLLLHAEADPDVPRPGQPPAP